MITSHKIINWKEDPEEEEDGEDREVQVKEIKEDREVQVMQSLEVMKMLKKVLIEEKKIVIKWKRMSLLFTRIKEKEDEEE